MGRTVDQVAARALAMREAGGVEGGRRWGPAVLGALVVVAGCANEPNAGASVAITAPAPSTLSSTSSVPVVSSPRPTSTPDATTAPSSTAGVMSTSTTSTTTTTTTTTTATVPALRQVSMAFSGDTLPHSPLWRQAERNAAAADVLGHDFDPMMAELAPLLDEVDLAVCHLETPIAPEGEEFTTMPLYGVPPEVIGMLATAGWDRCSTASNHTIDRGFEGIVRTVDTFDAYGLGQVGMARTPDEIEPRVFETNDVAISHLSYTWSYNGLRLAEGDEWQSALIDPDRILADSLVARSLGAEIVIVSLHWGAEGVHEPTSYQREIADQLTEPGLIDLIVGHHAHVVQPIERVNDTWVLFGLGNILSNLPTSHRWPAASQDAAVVTVEFEVTADGVDVARPVVHPTWVDQDAGWIVRLVQDELARDDIGAGQRGRLEESLRRTTGVLGEYLAEDTES